MWWLIVMIVVALGIIIWATTRKGKLGRWARLAVFFLSAGFVFPNVMTEDEDIAKSAATQDAKVKR
jgi:hypothetical protein